MDESLAQAKLHARLHDPAEKALVLLRDPAGHEGGTSRALHQILFPEGIPGATRNLVRKADRWASAADRPQFPKRPGDGRYPGWTQVNFAENPVLIHPLSGEAFDLRAKGGLVDTDFTAIKHQSIRHFQWLIQRDGDGNADWWRTLLAFWRFGPEVRPENDEARLGELWRRLPADTRVPDHTIWDHLDLVSAFAGAFQGDAQGRCALLSVSLGPVQDFIAAARTTSDLWAGSHLLARLSWEAMRLVCERFGPDAVLFPSLRGVPQVDLWLMEQGLDASLFAEESWYGKGSDSSPLFSAALPNRFVAIVPADRAEALATDIETHVRDWVRGKAREVVSRLLQVAGLEDAPDVHAHQQTREQLAGFPEVHWSVVAYDELLDTAAPGEETRFNTEALVEALSPFHGDDDAPGFLGSPAWQVLQRPVELAEAEEAEHTVFYRPNPGVLYPALYGLGERAMAGAKALRPFAALDQHGYRGSLTGEAEWLTHDAEQLSLPPGQRAEADTLWTRIAQERPAWARKGEHLGALAALKRLWPTLFCEELANVPGQDNVPARFVVSTHTMALATSLTKLAKEGGNLGALSPEDREAIRDADRTALPRKLVGWLRDHEDGALIHRLPGWLEEAADQRDDEAELQRRRGVLDRCLGNKPETYYAMILMDGDYMGRWLSGDREHAIAYARSFHPAIRSALQNRFPGHVGLRAYLAEPRAVSPGRHIAISSALNDFSSVIAREVVEKEFAGRVLYAGGDDLMAMLPTRDLFGAMQRLRRVYSGVADEEEERQQNGLRSGGGFVRLHKRLHLTMGEAATASIGAVIAHHQTPLAVVLRELHAAEKSAKRDGDRDAFSVSVLKRSGGALRLTDKWCKPDNAIADAMTTLRAFADQVANDEDTSRRAAYNIEGWLPDLPEPGALGGPQGMQVYLQAMLHQQFQRQGVEQDGQPVHSRRFAALAVREDAKATRERLANLLGVAEFMARETRS